MYCITLTVRRHALIVHMLIKTLPARAGIYFGLYYTVAGCNENLTYIKKALIFSCRSVTMYIGTVTDFPTASTFYCEGSDTLAGEDLELQEGLEQTQSLLQNFQVRRDSNRCKACSRTSKSECSSHCRGRGILDEANRTLSSIPRLLRVSSTISSDRPHQEWDLGASQCVCPG